MEVIEYGEKGSINILTTVTPDKKVDSLIEDLLLKKI